MPAPLARGLIFSISLLIAAGIAVYENPQVREWLDESRRKIALSLHNLGDDIHPSNRAREDASMQEDESPEAVERRRLAREEIMARSRILDEKRGSTPKARRGSSFDDIVDEEGRLHQEYSEAATSAAEVSAADGNLRKRHIEAAGIATGAAAAAPFADEWGMDLDEKTPELPPRPQKSRESTATLIDKPLALDLDALNSSRSETPVELTPTTSAAPSSFPIVVPDTPTSESDMEDGWEQPREAPLPSGFCSVYNWAESASGSFYSTPESEPSSVHSDTLSERSLDESIIDVDDSVSQVDMMSEGDNISTPGSWTEVGSMISENSNQVV